MSKEKNEDLAWDLLIFAIFAIVVLSAIIDNKRITYYSKVEDNQFEVCTLNIARDKSVCIIEDKHESAVSVKKENLRKFLQHWNDKSPLYKLWYKPSQLVLELDKRGIVL